MENIYKLSETSMSMKTGKFNQGDSDFIRFFYDLFYRANKLLPIDDKLLPDNKSIDVLICGAGSCVHELPVLLYLFESDKYNRVNLTFVDKAEEPFKLLHYILQKYDKGYRDSKAKEEVEKEEDAKKEITKKEIAEYFSIKDCNYETGHRYSICNNKINYCFQVMDLELDPHENTTNRYTEFKEHFKDDTKYDIVMMSMLLQHIFYWRSLIAFLNNHLKKGGCFWFNELGKDDYLLTLDFYMAIIDNKRKEGKWKDFESSIINYFESNRDKDQMLFSIISDNYEISSTNTEICRDFFDFFDSKGKIIFEEGFQSDIKPSELFKNAKKYFSPFTKFHSFIGGDTLSPTFSENNSNEKLDFTMTWYAYPKVEDKKIYHFNVLDEAAHMEIPDLQQYINRTLDILNINSTIFRPTFLRREATSETMVKLAIGLFRRFQLFKIGDFQSIVFYIPGLASVECLKDTKENYEKNFTSQQKFIEKTIRPYNKYRKDRREEGSNSNYFFDKYKTKLTKPFSIFYEPLDRDTNETISWENIGFEINEYDYSTNRKVHKITVNGKQDDSSLKGIIVTPLGVSYNLRSLRDWYRAYNDYFEGYRSIFIPCFREPLFDKNKEFLGDLIMFQKKVDNIDNKRDDTPIEFFSWLIRKFIDFTQIATYLDYKRIILQSLESAIAAIMSRNMSHNLGSHFVSNTKNDFGRRINDDRIFDKNNVGEKDLKAIRMDYRGNVRLLQYIQERMDFIATIVSTDHYALGPLNFKAEFFDILTNDDCGERHGKPERNFMLQYLLYSEKYTRSCFDKIDGFGNVRLVVKYKGEEYTGLATKNEEEQQLKTELSKLRLAIPGGVMSRHALLTIVENILRNSAKHNEHIDELVLTIEIKEENGECELSFYDNCNSAEKKVKRSDDTEIEVYKSIEEKLKHVTIINDKGVLDKHDKGLKEMLICALWLQNKDVAETLLKIQQGVDSTDYIKVGEKDGNLCYTIKLKNFEDYKMMDKQPSVEELLGIRADFVISEEDYEVGEGENIKKLSEIFPRFVKGNSCGDVKKRMEKKLEEYALVVEADMGEEKLPSVYSKDDKSIPKEKKRICFYDHLTNAGKENDFEVAKNDEKIVYLDSISGENFTSTLVTPLFLKEDIQRYKVIQSALAKIAILDERIWSDCRSRCTIRTESDNANKEKYTVVLKRLNEADMTSSELLNDISKIDYDYYEELDKSIQGMPEETNKLERLKTLLKEKINAKLFVPDITCQLLETKHIYVYSIEDGKLIGLDGNEVTELPDFNFVTVHLGLIEKLPKASGGFEKFLADKVIGKKSGNHGPFVAIHSGRGNFSPELEESLRGYPFLSLSAVESALNNSKYLLSELFYNTNYYGKGNSNHK